MVETIIDRRHLEGTVVDAAYLPKKRLNIRRGYVPPPTVVNRNRPKYRPSRTSSRLLNCTRSNCEIAFGESHNAKSDKVGSRTRSQRAFAVVSGRTARFWYVLKQQGEMLWIGNCGTTHLRSCWKIDTVRRASPGFAIGRGGRTSMAQPQCPRGTCL